MLLHSLFVQHTLLNHRFLFQATYISQLGGNKHSDFLMRALPKVISDEVCFLTNWSGSEIPEGSEDFTGTPITRKFKKTFANLSNITEMFCCKYWTDMLSSSESGGKRVL